MSSEVTTVETSPAASAPAAAPAATPAPAASPAAPATPASMLDTPAVPADQPAAAPADGQPAPADGAPEAYDLVAPEGTTFDEELLGELKTLAKESNMPKEQAQKLAEMGQKAVQKYQARMSEQIVEQQQKWVNDSRADKEFGGDKLGENLAVAKKARDAFGTPELTQLLNESGIGNHPEVIRFFFRAGQAISEDRLVPGGVKPAATPTAQNLYSKSQMNP